MTSWAQPKVQFRLRDWLISRQHYWSCPIQSSIATVVRPTAVFRKIELPVRLPKDADLSGKGGSPLAQLESWSFVPLAPAAVASPPRKPTPWTPSLFVPGISCASLIPATAAHLSASDRPLVARQAIRPGHRARHCTCCMPVSSRGLLQASRGLDHRRAV